METKEAGTSLDSLMSSFNTRIAHLQQLISARTMCPSSSISDLSGIDAALKAMELQVHNIKHRLREEHQAIPKAKKLIEASLRQQKKLKDMSACVPTYLPERMISRNQNAQNCVPPEPCQDDLSFESLKNEEPAAPKVKKGRASAPLWYISADELISLPQYMKGRLTLEKVNAAINDMAAYADANAQLIAAPRKKELREIASSEVIKGKHFFLETDIKGPTLKFDTTGKGILTVLRHLGRISEDRIGHHRVIILLRPQ